MALIATDVFPRDRAIASTLIAWFLVVGGIGSGSYFTDRFNDFPPPAIFFIVTVLTALLVSLLVPRSGDLWASLPTERLRNISLAPRALIGLAGLE